MIGLGHEIEPASTASPARAKLDWAQLGLGDLTNDASPVPLLMLSSLLLQMILYSLCALGKSTSAE